MIQRQNQYTQGKKNRSLYLVTAFALLLSGSLMILQAITENHQQKQDISHIPDSLIKVQNVSSGNGINQISKGKNSKTPCYTSKSQSGMTEVDLRNCKLDKNTKPNKPNKVLSRA